MMNDDILQRMLAPLMRGVRLLFGRGILTGTSDGLKMQNAQMTSLDGETFDDVERPQQYGQISVPLPGAETFFGCLMGDRDQAVILVVEDKRYRPTGLPDGDSGIYHYEGHRLRLTKDGRAILTCKTLEVYADDHTRTYSAAPKPHWTVTRKTVCWPWSGCRGSLTCRPAVTHSSPPCLLPW